MNAVRARAAEQSPDIDIPWSNMGLMVPIFTLATHAFRPEIHFEGGVEGQQMWKEHINSGAPSEILMTHTEEADAVMMAPIAQKIPALHGIRYQTIVTAKESLRRLNLGVSLIGGLPGWIVREGGTVAVERPFDKLNETPEEALDRKAKNQISRAVRVAVAEAGGSNVLFPEGGTRKRIKLPNGEYAVVDRERDELLPHQRGYADDIHACNQETQDYAHRYQVS